MKATILFIFSLCSFHAYAVEYTPLPPSVLMKEQAKVAVPFDLELLKKQWRERINLIRHSGVLPIIDIESSFNPGKLNARDYARAMDKNGVALTAFSPQVGRKKYNNNGTLWSDGARRAVAVDPTRYIPTSTAGIYPAWSSEPLAFVKQTIKRVERDRYPLLGEFEFRHYMSPRQYRRNQTERDVTVPIDSEAGHLLFDFAQRRGISFQIHYEVEDSLLAPLETMLKKYPRARVIWCHVGQMRYAKRATRYGPTYVRYLIEHYPNLYFDLAFGDAGSVYPASNEYHATVWDRKNGGVKAAWLDLIKDYPYRFLAALDIGGDRMNQVSKKTATLRRFLGYLPQDVQEIVAYKAAWKLLFDETLE